MLQGEMLQGETLQGEMCEGETLYILCRSLWESLGVSESG